ncbi:MAG: histidine kinase N-terminal 7TM domain-containing protein, partial [Candidatus Hodarchaeales archaeon]
MSTELLGEYFFNPWSIPYLLSALASFIIALILIYKAERTPPLLLFTSAQLSNFIVSLTSALASSVQEGHPDLWSFWMNSNNAISLLTVIFFFHFSFSYLNNNKLIPNKMILSIYILPLVSFLGRPLFYYQNTILSDRSAYGLYDVESSDLITMQYILHYAIIAIFLLLTARNFLKLYRSKDIYLKQISGYFLLASLIPLFALTLVLL